ncbi:MAG: hypothetical protein GY795_44510 [Desulfobacterales bacterium]|nr:hypothetical protein [Desulfobacterales bacterium]
MVILRLSASEKKLHMAIGGEVGKILGRSRISVKSHAQKGLEKAMVKLVNAGRTAD